MRSATMRIISTILAIIISSLIVYALSHAGRESKGPIETAMVATGEMVKDIEKKLIVEQREEKREDKLAWFKPYTTSKKMLLKPGKILLGAFDNEMKESFERMVALEDSIRTTFPLVHIYAAWGSKTEERFPADQVKNIISLGSTPVITWEPWLSDFNEEAYPEGQKPEDPDKNGMRNIAAGTYDTYIKEWAAQARKIGRPIFVRFGHEMNDGYRYPWGPQNNSPQDFIAAWQHVYNIFEGEGARNIIWIWSPHPAYTFKEFYPGDEYVDYIGAGVLNYGTVAAWSKWWTFDEIVGKYYDSVEVYKKPVMITEFGSLAVGGNRAKWYAGALERLPQRYPLIKSIVFFHFSKDNTTTQQTLNWYFKKDSAVSAAVAKAVGKW
jgi:beta-mannanase